MTSFMRRLYRMENPKFDYARDPEIDLIAEELLKKLDFEGDELLLNLFDEIMKKGEENRKKAYRTGFRAGAAVTHELLTFGKADTRRS